MKSDGGKKTRVISLRIPSSTLDRIDSKMSDSLFYVTRNEFMVSALRDGYTALVNHLIIAIRHDDYSRLAYMMIGLGRAVMSFDKEGSKDSQLLIRVPEGFYDSISQVVNLLNVSVTDFTKYCIYRKVHYDLLSSRKDSMLELLPEYDPMKLKDAIDREELRFLAYDRENPDAKEMED